MARPRVTGLETEYALMSGKEAPFLVNQGPTSVLLTSLFPSSPIFSNHYANSFLYNGARFYVDTGSHPEYATPECQSVKTLTAHERAGMHMLEEAENLLNSCFKDKELLELLLKNTLLEGYNKRNCLEKFSSYYFPIKIYKNNLAVNKDYDNKSPVSWGSHENYLMSSGIAFEKIEQGLMPFLITRQIYGGSGWLELNDKNSFLQFYLAQRPLVTAFDVGGLTTKTRSIICSKNEPLADNYKWRRLHLTMGDSNMSPWALWLKIKITSMIIDLIEDGSFILTPDFRELPNPVFHFREISRDLSFSHAFLWGGIRHTALSVQKFYLELVRKFFLEEQRKEADEETKNAIELWEAVLTAMENRQFDVLAPWLDNFAKLFLMQKTLEKSGMSFADRKDSSVYFKKGAVKSDLLHYLKLIDFSYHRVNKKESAFFVFQKSSACQELKLEIAEKLPFLKNALVSEEEAEKARWLPPCGRARWRFEATKLIEKLNNSMRLERAAIDWNYVRATFQGGKRLTLTNNDPYCEITPELKLAISEFEKTGII